MSERARVLKVGGVLLGLLVAGLVVGFLVLGRNDEGLPASATGDATPTPTDVRAQVEQAYLHAWDVWAEALLELDPSNLDEALTGRALELVTEQVEAQAVMNRAVAMLHSFWFPEARGTFESVVKADPGCGIAYWGIAMTHFGNPMAGGSVAEGQAAGWAAAKKAASIGGRSDRDRAYIAAAVALFQDHEAVNNPPRMRKYEAALKLGWTRRNKDFADLDLFNQVLERFLAQVDAGRWPMRDPRAVSESITGMR